MVFSINELKKKSIVTGIFNYYSENALCRQLIGMILLAVPVVKSQD